MESPRFDDGEKKDNEPLDTVKSLQIGEITMVCQLLPTMLILAKMADSIELV
jgi:hypothetical protein